MVLLINLKNYLLILKKIDPNLVEKYFHKRSLIGLLKNSKTSKKVVYVSSKQLLVETNLEDLKYEIKTMSDDEVRYKKLDLLVDFFEKTHNATKK